MSPRPQFGSVSAYLAALDPKPRAALRSVLAAVGEVAPAAATRVISYGIPAFRLNRVFIYCAAFKHHIGIYPPVRDDPRLSKALEPYANAKGNLSFALAEPMPLPLIRRVAKSLARGDAATRAVKPRKKTRTGRSPAGTTGKAGKRRAT